MAKEEKEIKKEKRPSAQKRDMQHTKRRSRNRMFNSSVKTAIRHYDEVLEKGETDKTNESLNQIYSLLDKGVKKGIFKLNKASRTKSRLAARIP